MSRWRLLPSLDTDPEDSLRFFDEERDDEVLFTGCYPISIDYPECNDCSDEMIITMTIRYD